MALTKHIARAAYAVGVPKTPPAAINPAGAENWSGYWTFVTATLTLAFILYVTQKGDLGTWLQFLSWSAPPTSIDNTAGQTVANNQAAVAAGTTSGAATTFGALPTGGTPMNFGQVFQQLFGTGPYAPNNTPVTTPPGSGGIGSA